MKTPSNKICIAAATGFFLLSSLAACRKENTTDTDNGYAAEQATMERSFDDVQSITDQAAATGSLANFRTTGNCTTITNDTTSNPHVLTVDFGTTNCEGNDGRMRRGKIICTYTGQYKDSGHVHTITFDNFFVNDNQLTGTKTVTNMGTNIAGNYYYTIEVNGSMILANGAGTRTWLASCTRTWTSGYNTPAWSDDAYDISGSGTLTRANGNVITTSITTPLHKAMSCNWIESGVVTLTPQSGNMRTLDYGSTGCDANATLTADGTTTNITLP